MKIVNAVTGDPQTERIRLLDKRLLEEVFSMKNEMGKFFSISKYENFLMFEIRKISSANTQYTYTVHKVIFFLV